MSKLILPRNMKREKNEELPQESLKNLRSKELITTAGELLAQPGAEYLGSATVHYYVRSILDNEHTYETIQQISVSKVAEGFADYGFKQLQKALMEAYGRKDRATR